MNVLEWLWSRFCQGLVLGIALPIAWVVERLERRREAR